MNTTNHNSKSDLTDPVCGMTVTEDSDYHFKYEHHQYYFCSSGCRDKFVASPEAYDQQADKHESVALKDPVCGMEVTADSEHHLQHNHHDYYFCSQGCEDKFNASPEKYLSVEQHKTNTTAEVADYCPDGSCDIGAVFYTCPMHPEIRQEHPGVCPKCGMALEAAGEPAPCILKLFRIIPVAARNAAWHWNLKPWQRKKKMPSLKI